MPHVQRSEIIYNPESGKLFKTEYPILVFRMGEKTTYAPEHSEREEKHGFGLPKGLQGSFLISESRIPGSVAALRIKCSVSLTIP